MSSFSYRFFARFVRDGGPGCTERFIHTMDLFFKAVAQQSADRAHGWIPDLESYVPLRRDTSGCKPCFALIEYAAGIDLPDYVVGHPTIRALEEATNDLVTWSNVYPSPVFPPAFSHTPTHLRTYSRIASSDRAMTRTT
jgi:Terpene synthase family 2, C-terminal metal binding